MSAQAPQAASTITPVAVQERTREDLTQQYGRLAH